MDSREHATALHLSVPHGYAGAPRSQPAQPGPPHWGPRQTPLGLSRRAIQVMLRASGVALVREGDARCHCMVMGCQVPLHVYAASRLSCMQDCHTAAQTAIVHSVRVRVRARARVWVRVRVPQLNLWVGDYSGPVLCPISPNPPSVFRVRVPQLNLVSKGVSRDTGEVRVSYDTAGGQGLLAP